MLKARKEAEEITELLQEQNEVDDSNIRNIVPTPEYTPTEAEFSI